MNAGLVRYEAQGCAVIEIWPAWAEFAERREEVFHGFDSAQALVVAVALNALESKRDHECRVELAIDELIVETGGSVR